MNISSQDLDHSESASSLTSDERQFIESFAVLLADRGMSPSAGRVYGYLLLRQGPLSIDQIASDLEMSRVGAWNSAKSLEAYGHVRRFGTQGSKRSLYASSDDFGAPLLRQAALLGDIGLLLQSGSKNLVSGKAAEELQGRADFYLSIQQAMEAKVTELNRLRSGLSAQLNNSEKENNNESIS